MPERAPYHFASVPDIFRQLADLADVCTSPWYWTLLIYKLVLCQALERGLFYTQPANDDGCEGQCKDGKVENYLTSSQRMS